MFEAVMCIMAIGAGWYLKHDFVLAFSNFFIAKGNEKGAKSWALNYDQELWVKEFYIVECLYFQNHTIYLAKIKNKNHTICIQWINDI